MSVLVIGEPAALALAGLDPEPGKPELIVVLDDAEAPSEPGAPVVRWWRGAPLRAPDCEHVIAVGGDALHSRAPWPVREALFTLAPADAPGRVLVVEPVAEIRAAALAQLAAQGSAADGVERLTVEALADADIVVHGCGQPGPLPGDAIAVLAAARLLVTNADPAFGLRSGVDFLAAGDISHACALVRSAIALPAAFAAMRRHGRIAAARHRAPEVYGRLLADLRAI